MGILFQAQNKTTKNKQKKTYLLFQVRGQEGFFALLQEEDNHEGEDIWWQPTFLCTVNHTDLNQKQELEVKNIFDKENMYTCTLNPFYQLLGETYLGPASEAQNQWKEDMLPTGQRRKIGGGLESIFIPCTDFTDEATIRKNSYFSFHLCFSLLHVLIPCGSNFHLACIKTHSGSFIIKS